MTVELSPVREWMEETGALENGHFLLSSGLHSPAYVQCARLLEHPERAERLGADLARLLVTQKVESILSPALGGLIIGYEVASSLGVPFRFVERVDGQMALRRGFAFGPGERVAVVEDVVTTGRSTLEAISTAQAEGAEIVAVASILDRREGRSPFAVPFFSLFDLSLPSYRPTDCPLCSAGQSLSKPGSRPIP